MSCRNEKNEIIPCPQKSKQSPLSVFLVLTILTVLVFAAGYAIIYRLTWDLAPMLFPDWSYNSQSIFTLIFLSSLFVIMILITYRYYKRHDIREMMVSQEFPIK